MVSSSAEPVASSDHVVIALRSAGCVFAEQEAALLLREARDATELDAWLARRCGGEPLEHVLGWADFAGLRIAVAPGVFVPRRRTELLARLAVEAARGVLAPVAVDLCCGSGAVGRAMVDSLPDLEVHAADLDPVAVACARRNLALVHEGDLFAALPQTLRGRVDVLAVNAPYVPTAEIARMPPEARLHEPRLALDGGSDGVDVHRRVAAAAPQWLAPGGVLLIETSRAQAGATAHECLGAELETSVIRDEDVDGTVVRAISAPRRSSGTMAR